MRAIFWLPVVSLLPKSSDKDNMRHELKEFLLYLQLNCRRTNRTLEIYSQVLTDFDKFLDSTPMGEDEARAFLCSKMPKLQASTQALYASVLRHLSKWLYLKGLAAAKWNIKSPKQSSKKIQVFSEEDLLLLLKVVENKNAEERVLFYLLYGSGLRISEALSLELKNIHYPTQSARVLGKAKRWREFPLTAQLLLALRDLALEGQGGSETWHGGALNYQKARKWVQNWGDEAGFNAMQKNLRPHLLRHAVASHLLKRGGSLAHIQKLLGHKCLSTTQKYTHLNIEDLIVAYDKAMPKKNVA